MTLAKDANSKRSDDSDITNSTIFPRTMTTDKDSKSVEEFMIKETEKATLLWWRNADGYDVNNARFLKFKDDEAFSYSMRGLAGCTGMVIVSKKGVYLAHYWESISFSQNTIDEDSDQTRYTTQDRAFHYTIIHALRNGINRQGIVEQDSLKAHAGEIDDDSIQGYLMIPRTGYAVEGIGPQDPYRTYWEKLKKEVGTILPRLNPDTNPNRWHEYKYRPVEKEETTEDFDPLEKTARGRLLFKYDPDHHGRKKTFLMMETELQQDASTEWD
ncbi:hypothetical protein CkaCkLH20_01757 [Colletotrichum karsti]|uniref:Uncharacterized protein n=1 Tax=Colletotrichum karsti TaxID=1095194 RepID=A0A9P6IDP1_9PEZI|nr:uncharacterized protein CkaCkLH20_01757 [Colletotrichum karsti]KAF9880715.1 hypothetical protein CkaCkLH20_01757 [Colletotrichum karsti]